MASEVVCGLVFRLLLPVCLAAGEFLLFTHVGTVCVCVRVRVRDRMFTLEVKNWEFSIPKMLFTRDLPWNPQLVQVHQKFSQASAPPFPSHLLLKSLKIANATRLQLRGADLWLLMSFFFFFVL